MHEGSPSQLRGAERRALYARLLGEGIAAEKAGVEELIKAAESAQAMELPPLPIEHLRFDGNGHARDSFSLAVQAAAHRLGRKVDYDTVACLYDAAKAAGLQAMAELFLSGRRAHRPPPRREGRGTR